jgi:hypothetical protein
MINIMENSQTNDSFQHELEDYIRKQRARGLQPKVCFKAAVDSMHREGAHIGPKSPVLEQQLSFRWLPSSPAWPKIHHSRKRLESLNHHQKNHHYFFKSPGFQSHGLFWEDHSRVYWPGHPDRSQRRRHREKEGRPTTEEPGEPKKNHYVEGDFHKEYQDLRKAEIEPVATEKPKHRKNCQDEGDTTKGRSQSHRERKRAGKESAEERDLWDAAILGSNY